jgi:class 3 adenylate cyclase
MALEMRARAEDLRCGWLKAGYDLALGVGFATGYATLGEIGFENRRDYAAVGNVTNLAARLCEVAKGGQIRTNQRTLSKLENLVEAEPLEEFHLKGLARPVVVFNILRPRE